MFKYHERAEYSSANHNIEWKSIEPKSYETQVNDFDSALEWLQQEEWHVHDCDGGNDDKYVVGITDGKTTKYYEVFHEFWANHWWDDKGERHFTVPNQFTINEIAKEKANIPNDRDWLNISEYNYKLAKKWPPENG